MEQNSREHTSPNRRLREAFFPHHKIILLIQRQVRKYRNELQKSRTIC
jgi:hypothetical protein